MTTREEYDYCINRGGNPLIDIKNFKLDISLRVEIQRELFGHCIFGRCSNIVAANDRFYRWIWDNKPHQCEETLRPLNSYSAVYISHILARGSHPEMAHDPRNVNILCFLSHSRWENGDKYNMRIYPKNKKMIELLLSEYNQLRTIK